MTRASLPTADAILFDRYVLPRGKIKPDRVSLKNVLASSPRTIWVPRENCRKVLAGCGGSPASEKGRRRFSKLDISRQEALSRTLRSLSAGARIPLAGIAGLRAAIRRRMTRGGRVNQT